MTQSKSNFLLIFALLRYMLIYEYDIIRQIISRTRAKLMFTRSDIHHKLKDYTAFAMQILSIKMVETKITQGEENFGSKMKQVPF